MAKGEQNVYTCQKCGGHTVTIDVDEGVTPFMIGCRADRIIEKRCEGMAYSNFYPEKPWPAHIPREAKWEWYKPTDAELRKNYKDDDMYAQMKEYVDKGGLDMRRRKP